MTRSLAARVCLTAALHATALGSPAVARAQAQTPRGAAPKPARPGQPASPGAGATPPPGAPQDLVAKGRALFEDQQYEESVQTLSAALLRPGNTKGQTIEIYRLLALDYITLGRNDEAESAVRGLLVIQPDYQLPASESPRFRDFFGQTRAKWEAEGRPGLVREEAPPKPIVLKHASPSEAEPEQALELRGRLDDPDARARGVRLYYRSGTRGDFREAEVERSGAAFRAQLPGAAVRPPLVEYYLVAVDASGEPLASRGEPSAPLRIAVAEPSKGWVLPVAIGGGLLGAAAIVGGLALAGVFKGSSPPPGPGTSIVSVSVSEASR